MLDGGCKCNIISYQDDIENMIITLSYNFVVSSIKFRWHLCLNKIYCHATEQCHKTSYDCNIAFWCLFNLHKDDLDKTFSPLYFLHTIGNKTLSIFMLALQSWCLTISRLCLVTILKAYSFAFVHAFRACFSWAYSWWCCIPLAMQTTFMHMLYPSGHAYDPKIPLSEISVARRELRLAKLFLSKP